MKVLLLQKNDDFTVRKEFSIHEETLFKDLELQIICNAMAGDDNPLLFSISKTAILTTTADLETIQYRQDILKDCLKNRDIIQNLYQLTETGIQGDKNHYYNIFVNYPSSILHYSDETLNFYMMILKKIRTIADEKASLFSSDGFVQLFSMLQQELTDSYFTEIADHLKNLDFPHGLSVSASLGEANKGINYVLRKQKKSNKNWLQKLFAKKEPGFTFQLAERDESGARAFSELKDIAINTTANTLAQSVDHILAFFTQLQIELGFYIGCLNLYDQLIEKKLFISFPVAFPLNEHQLSFLKLYDSCLALGTDTCIQSNDLSANKKDFIFITGANQGGKSTFLRSMGIAHLMMQCGMFVCAELFQASVCTKIFTHYRKEEDHSMTSGKLDEELLRMDAIIKDITPHCLVLFNESFAATNERDGSEIARQITQGLLENDIKLFFVTHLYEFPHAFFNKHVENILFLQAQRSPDGKRSFQFTEKEPSATSYGQDLYNTIFL